jgi:hypothetical protein
MDVVIRIIAVLTLPALFLGSKTESNNITVQSVAQLVSEIYHKIHSKFVILLHESTKNEGRKYYSKFNSL